jgi:hypothetical protein
MPYLASGLPGVAWALREYAVCAQDESALAASSQILADAAQATRQSPFDGTGLFEGMGGFVCAVDAVASIETRFRPSLLSLAEQFATLTHRQAYGVHVSDPAMHTYDVLQGASGQLNAALILGASDALNTQRDDLRAVATQRAKYLVEIVRSLRGSHFGFFIAPEFFPTQEGTFWSRFPHGQYNLGVAHGFPGILAALSVARLHDVSVIDLDPAIRSLCEHLNAWKQRDALGVTWNSAVAPERVPPPVDDTPFARTAWCYGAPGIAMALEVAHRALGDPAIGRLAGDARDASLARVRAGAVDNVAVCHGLAGILSALRVSPDEAPDLYEILVGAVSSDEPHGLRPRSLEQHVLNTSSLLDGGAGVLMALTQSRTAIADWPLSRLLLAG